MTLPELEALARSGRLKREVATQAEFDGLVRSGLTRLKDAQGSTLAIESRFDLAYNASHSLALAALRWHGFRSESRYIVFQVLPHTLGLEPGVWRVFDKAHSVRNVSEYEGYSRLDPRLVEDLLVAAKTLQAAVLKLGPVEQATN
ncbi:MAG: hypothetical protein M1274_13300 [Actinobacteria bacterium]|nr:hypothetical protein [Actinomycetota bacterium]